MTVSVFYPDANPETTSVDGYTTAAPFPVTDFAGTRSAAGDASDDTGSNSGPWARLVASFMEAADTWQQLNRGIILFDTSAIPTADIKSAAILRLYNNINYTDIGACDVDVVSSNPASNTGLVAADHTTLGTTVYASIALSSITPSANNNFTIDATGIATINNDGISKFGIRLSWDTDNSFTGTWIDSGETSARFAAADIGGTTSDPQLTVTHAAASTFTPRAVVIS